MLKGVKTYIIIKRINKKDVNNLIFVNFNLKYKCKFLSLKSRKKGNKKKFKFDSKKII